MIQNTIKRNQCAKRMSLILRVSFKKAIMKVKFVTVESTTKEKGGMKPQKTESRLASQKEKK